MKYLLDNNGNETKYQYQVTSGRIRVYVEENRIVWDPEEKAFVKKLITFDRTFHIGDFCLMNYDYIGVIHEINERGVSIYKDVIGYGYQPRGYSLKRFIELNYDYDGGLQLLSTAA